MIVTNSPQTFHWDGYGFKLTIPQGSLPAGVDQCRLDIKASVAGQYLFPNNLQLVSGVFWIRPLPSGRFQQQLTVEIQHCAKMTSSTKLSFVRAHCSQESLPYTFKHLEGCGSFTEHSSYGSLELSQFSGLAVTGENVERVYTASLYYLGSELYSREIHFVVNWDNDIHNTVSDTIIIQQFIVSLQFVSEKYSTKEAILGVNHFVEFEGDRITLDIPIDGTKVKGGWKITPMFHPTVGIIICSLAQPAPDVFYLNARSIMGLVNLTAAVNWRQKEGKIVMQSSLLLPNLLQFLAKCN